jgi:hypothetical protein
MNGHLKAVWEMVIFFLQDSSMKAPVGGLLEMGAYNV